MTYGRSAENQKQISNTATMSLYKLRGYSRKIFVLLYISSLRCPSRMNPISNPVKKFKIVL
jgi:hypothetical protein